MLYSTHWRIARKGKNVYNRDEGKEASVQSPGPCTEASFIYHLFLSCFSEKISLAVFPAVVQYVKNIEMKGCSVVTTL